MGFIYLIVSPTDRMYIGQTVNIVKRYTDYRRSINYNTSERMVINSIKKYGLDNHLFQVIEEVDNSLLMEREIFWIKELQTYWKDGKGMNMTRGGEAGSGSWIHDIERRNKQSKRFSGNGNPFYGKTHNQEWRVKKSKEVSSYNKTNGIKIPTWGAKKGLQKIRKAVICYNSKGDFVKEFDCGSSASKELLLSHTSISMVCNLKRTHVGGFVFRYKTENYPLKIDVGDLKEQAVKKEVILIRRFKKNKTFSSPESASKETGVPVTTIRRAARYNNMKPIRNGLIFVYKEDYGKPPKASSTKSGAAFKTKPPFVLKGN